MKKFRFWAILGIVVNVVILLRGILLPFVDASGWQLWGWVVLGLLFIAIAVPGIISSIWILQKKKAGFTMARIQVWFLALTEALPTVLLMAGPGANPRYGIVGVFITLVFASQLSKLFNSEEAMAYCKN
jgi:hypothetical protein